MKRLIKYWNTYESDKNRFATTSTHFEALPVLVDDSCGNIDLRILGKEQGFKPLGNVSKLERGILTHSIKIDETKTINDFRESRQTQCFIGLVKVDDTIKPIESINNPLTQDQCYEIIENQAYGIRDAITINNENMIVLESWDAFSALAFAGYSLNAFAVNFDAVDCKGKAETVFEDEVSQCGDCGEWDYNDNGYNQNFRVIGCELFGVDCGCAHEAQKNNLDDYIDNPDQALDLDAATELSEEGTLEHVERFIGGMTDGRGGFYAGKPCRESSPESALKEFQAKHPDTSFIFTHDESGQFQTYFSIWKMKEGN